MVDGPSISTEVTSLYVILLSLIGIAFAVKYWLQNASIDITQPLLSSGEHERNFSSDSSPRESRGLVARNVGDSASADLEVAEEPQFIMSVKEIADAISEGANSFLFTEYMYMGAFMVVFGLILFIVLGSAGSLDESIMTGWSSAGLTVFCFFMGSITSVFAGWIGMRVAVFSNSRTALRAQYGFGPGFETAFKAGAIMGFSLVGMGVLMLLFTIYLMWSAFGDDALAEKKNMGTVMMFETVAGFGLGGSCVALFGRVGGGIYTKAADVGADLVGKVEQGIPEDDPRNPAVIADNVGDNVGDIAGMGADLFGSFAESSCAAMVLAAESDDLFQYFSSTIFPIVVIASGLFISLITSFFATHWYPVRREADVEKSLKQQLLVSTVLMTPTAFLLSLLFLPSTFTLSAAKSDIKNWHAFFCVASGLWSGLIIGYFTEYYTSFSYGPVKEVAKSCETGAATNIIYGLSLGYKSTIIPSFCMFITIYVSFQIAGMYGIALAAIGILSTMATGLTIDAYGPISDNAGGIAEMAHMGEETRRITDCLDAAGNTTAAIGKGFAIGSAALVSLALFGAFVTTIAREKEGDESAKFNVNILEPLPFGGLLLGAMLPYWFSAMTMRSVGQAALAMVHEVRRQFRDHPGILEGTEKPNYADCVRISTDASIKEMIAPSALVIFAPIVCGFLLGPDALAGLLAGALTSGVQMAISASNTGGAWDNAKKYIEKGNHGGKGSPEHHAAVVGDTVGDPLKDTSGPALNILIKLMAIISLVFGRSFPSEGYLFKIF